MRSRYLLLVILAVVAGWMAIDLTTPAPSTAAPAAAPDAELAYIDTASFIQVVDPVAQPGQAPFTWTSSSAGWTNFTVLDVNADGIDEILAIGGGTARLWNPTAPGGGPAPSFLETLPSGFVYTFVAAGDVIPGDGGRDEIILQRTDDRGNSSYSIQIYDGDETGTQWTKVYDELFGGPWIRLATGDYNGLAGDELVMVREVDKRIKIISRTDTGGWGVVADNTYTFPWIDVALGNVNPGNGALEELVTTRGGVLGTFPSILVFWYAPPNPVADAPNGQRTAFPYFTDIALADVTGSGDQEAFFIRDPQKDDGISMIGLNWGADSFPAVWDNPGLALGRDLKAITAGDVDGDGLDELVIARASSYEIFWNPGVDPNNRSGAIGAPLRSPVVIGAGNFDGSGLEPPRMSVSADVIEFQMLRGGANPAPQTFEVTNVGGGGAFLYDVSEFEDWLTVTPIEGTTPGTHTISINGQNLTPGVYEATISITARSNAVLDSPQQITVRLTVIPTGPLLEVEPASMNFAYNVGGVLPDPVTMSIRNAGDGGPQNYAITVSTDDGGNWLQVSKVRGQTDDTVTVSVAPQNLRPGAYSGQIRVDAGDIEGSPAVIPVSLTIEATGMVVTPTELTMVANAGANSPLAYVHIGQAVEGQNAIHWYAYAVPSGDWWDIQQSLADRDFSVEKTEDGFRLVEANGAVRQLSTVDWVILTPNNGFTPNDMQISLDMDKVPVGASRVTILVDGGPGTPNRFQGVDMLVSINNGGPWLPIILQP
ncbi:MAG: BACON domain-containing protein [Chloroflexi bacterium]|nr:BACON domain-containing protein [Chloroflexota bacterium]